MKTGLTLQLQNQQDPCAGHVVHLAHSCISFGAGGGERRGGPESCHQAPEAGDQGLER